jgi:hypothetical protein
MNRPGIYHTDNNRTVKIDGAQISGSLGPNVVVETDGVTARNVASGECAGDMYQIRKNPDQENAETVTKRAVEALEKIIHQATDIAEKDKPELTQALASVVRELQKGEDFDRNLIWMALGFAREIAANHLSRFREVLLPLAKDPEALRALDLAARPS